MLVLLASCGEPSSGRLLVDLKTDLVAQVEFSRVRTILDGVETLEHPVDDDGYFDGVRIARFEDVAPGEHSFSVELLEGNAVVASRPATIRLDGDLAATVIITRDCVGVVCPMSSACVGGECAPAECTVETPETCPVECTVDTDCSPAASCAEPTCVSGLCVLRGGSCGMGQYCDPDRGCRSEVEDLVAWYPFDGDLFDASGNGHDARCDACPTFAQGRLGMAVDFDGAEYLTIPHAPELVLEEAYTVSLWVRFDAVDVGRENVIFSKPIGSGIRNSWMLATRMPSGAFYFYSSSMDDNTFNFGADAVNEQWTHLAGVYDGAQTSLYVDGVLAEESAVSGVEFSNDDVLIGAELEGSIRLFIDARVDDVRVYSRALASEEIQALATP